jgi:hypothetical protein
MVFYQTIGVNRKAGLGARLAQGLEKIVPVAIVQENRLAPVSPAHDVTSRPGIFNAQVARHERILPRPAPPRKLRIGLSQRGGAAIKKELATKEHNDPSAASRNQRNRTTDFTDFTDKNSALCILDSHHPCHPCHPW